MRKLLTPPVKAELPVPPQELLNVAVPVPPAAEPPLPRTAEPVRPQPAASVKPLAPERYKIQVTVSRDTYDTLRRAQDLLRHSIPNGDPAQIIARALDRFVNELERKKAAVTERPRHTRAANARSRHIPADVKRAVWQRDGGRCRFVGSQGRCAEAGFLEYHHVVPYADGGQTTAGNLELRCRAHNRYETDLWSGAALAPGMREERTMW